MYWMPHPLFKNHSDTYVFDKINIISVPENKRVQRTLHLIIKHVLEYLIKPI